MEMLAQACARKIKSADPEHTASIEVMAYSLTVLFNTLLICTLSLGIGWLAGYAWETLTALLAISLLRVFSGGIHFRSSTACNVFSISVCTSIPLVAPYLTDPIGMTLSALSFIVMIRYAPLPDRNAQLPKKYYALFKCISVMIVSIGILTGSHVIGLAFLVQSLTIIPWRKEA